MLFVISSFPYLFTLSEWFWFLLLQNGIVIIVIVLVDECLYRVAIDRDWSYASRAKGESQGQLPHGKTFIERAVSLLENTILIIFFKITMVLARIV